MTHTDQACPKPSEVSGREWRGRWQSETAERNKTATPELPFWRATKRCEPRRPPRSECSARLRRVNQQGESWRNWTLALQMRARIALFSETTWINEEGLEGKVCVFVWVCMKKKGGGGRTAILKLSHPVSFYLWELVSVSDTNRVPLDLSL